MKSNGWNAGGTHRLHFLPMCSWNVSPSQLGITWGEKKQKQIEDMVPVLEKLLVSSEGKTHTHLTILKRITEQQINKLEMITGRALLSLLDSSPICPYHNWTLFEGDILSCLGAGKRFTYTTDMWLFFLMDPRLTSQSPMLTLLTFFLSYHTTNNPQVANEISALETHS